MLWKKGRRSDNVVDARGEGVVAVVCVSAGARG